MMKSMLLPAVLAAIAVLTAAGCVHFDYSGSDAPATGAAVAVLPHNTPQPAESKVLGKALVWGNYQDVSRERMLAKLESEAADRGANAVLITAEQIVPMGTVVTVDPMVQTMESVSSNNTYSINQMQKDFAGGYGQAELFGKNAKQPAAATGHDYKRIIRAEFLLCKNPVKMVRKGTIRKTDKPAVKNADKKAEKPAGKKDEKAAGKTAGK